MKILNEAVAEVATTVKEAKAHVHQYTAQRDLCNEWMKHAQDDRKAFEDPRQRRHCYTIDMGPNIALPNFEAEQPGDTYYMTPLNVFVFGVVDNSTEKKSKMNTYLWSEADGRRGANNIASCLLKDFEKRGFFDRGEDGEELAPFESLTICADNCGGQNKNHTVIRLLNWMVEAGYVKEARLLFFVKGHTKNSCDRMFNILKKEYHGRNTFTMEQLVIRLGRNELITIIQMEPTDFYDVHKWQNGYYRRIETGTINRTHIFEVLQENESTTLSLKDDRDCEPVTQDLLPKTNRGNASVLSAEDREKAIRSMYDDLKKPANGFILELSLIHI